MKLHVCHSTHYEYSEMVHFTSHQVLLRPREDHHTRVLSFSLRTMPSGSITWLRDTQENCIARCAIGGQSKQLVIHADMTVELLQENPFDFILEESAAHYPFHYSENDRESLGYYLMPLPASTQVSQWVDKVLGPRQGETLALLTKLCLQVFQSNHYNRREEMGFQSPNETLQLQSGTCRDFALLFMAACRELNVACRFVSGYLYVPPSQNNQENRAENAMHAWCEVYLPGAGWKGFDPTHGIMTGNFYIPVAVTGLPETINPVQGSYLYPGLVSNTLAVDVTIQKVA
jgi:Transglutaminase-like superfamily/Bacterial transglutaminase-like N-terminal region